MGKIIVDALKSEGVTEYVYAAYRNNKSEDQNSKEMEINKFWKEISESAKQTIFISVIISPASQGF
mgnify:FL=1